MLLGRFVVFGVGGWFVVGRAVASHVGGFGGGVYGDVVAAEAGCAAAHSECGVVGGGWVGGSEMEGEGVGRCDGGWNVFVCDGVMGRR